MVSNMKKRRWPFFTTCLGKKPVTSHHKVSKGLDSERQVQFNVDFSSLFIYFWDHKRHRRGQNLVLRVLASHLVSCLLIWVHQKMSKSN